MDALDIAIFSTDTRMKMPCEQKGTRPSAVDFERNASRIKYSQESK